MAESSQKFIARNRAPRVQIEYEVELYGAQKKVQLPFVMGVMADLAGKSDIAQPAIADRKFLDIDVDNFDDRMKATKPRAAFRVANTLTGEGELAVDLTFERMEDFSPAALARKVEPLRILLEARTQLSNLLTYMDGKTGAEALIERTLQDPALLAALAATAAPEAPPTPSQDSALEGLRQAAPAGTANPTDDTAVALDALRDSAPAGMVAEDGTAEALNSLRAAAPAAPQPRQDPTSEALEALRNKAPASETAGDDTAGQALNSLRDTTPASASDDEITPDPLESLRAATPTTPQPQQDPTAEALAALRNAAPAPGMDVDTVGQALNSLRDQPPHDPHPAGTEEDDPLAGLLADAAPVAAAEDRQLSLSELIGGQSDETDPLADLLADAAPTSDMLEHQDPLADLRGTEDALEGLLSEAGPVTGEPGAPAPMAGGDSAAPDMPPANTPTEGPGPQEPATAAPDPLADLDDLLATDAPDPDHPAVAETDALGDEAQDALADLDDLLAASPTAASPPAGGPGRASGFGRLRAPAPSPEALERPRFRMAFLGDFSGRAARGKMEIGDKLATRRAVRLDIDTLDAVIRGFATRLVLPVGSDGAGVALELDSLDALHPDELVENCTIFDALNGLRRRLSMPSLAPQALQEMQGWTGLADAAAPRIPPRSAAAHVPTDRKLSDFQKLIGDTAPRQAEVAPVEDLLGRIVGPHIVPDAPPEAATAIEAVEMAMGAALKMILHHPDFQALEAQWRGLDFLARRIETDTTLEIVLHDISAEEIAADLAAQEDLSQSGLYRLLMTPVETEGATGFSALFGLYSFEETPPHAELLGRIAQIAAHLHAPFFTAMTPGFLDIAKQDRHPLTARAWDALRDLEETAWLGLVSPRFLMRHPYGKRSDPIEAFAFEEFTEQEGLRGMLWANPVLLVATLLAAEWKAGGTGMTLGNVLSLGKMPYHFARDRHGDQIALPCTERNLTESRVRHALLRGFMPIVSPQGRDVVRLASFQSLAGQDIMGPWSGPPVPRTPQPEVSPLDIEVETETREKGTTTAPAEAGLSTEDELDSLLASFSDNDIPADPDAIDAELSALLEGL